MTASRRSRQRRDKRAPWPDEEKAPDTARHQGRKSATARSRFRETRLLCRELHGFFVDSFAGPAGNAAPVSFFCIDSREAVKFVMHVTEQSGGGGGCFA